MIGLVCMLRPLHQNEISLGLFPLFGFIFVLRCLEEAKEVENIVMVGCVIDLARFANDKTLQIFRGFAEHILLVVVRLVDW